MYPYEMGNNIRGILDIEPEEVSPSASLVQVFQDIADAARECGISGKMTPSQMADNILAIVKSKLNVVADETFTGHTMYCRSFYNGSQVAGNWTLAEGSQYAEINENGRIDIEDDVDSQTIVVSCQYGTTTATKSIVISQSTNQLTIECDNVLRGTSAVILARYNQTVVEPTWSVEDGSANATISQNGTLTILGNGDVVVQAIYEGITTQKTLEVEYVANTTSSTSIGDDNSLTTSTSTVV